MTIYLYVKQHSITKLKYFGKTNQNPYKYKGSGTYWKRHCKKHGFEYIETLEVYEFDCQNECTSFALEFSKNNDIVNSTEWANIKPENALDGNVPGFQRGPCSENTKLKISQTVKNKMKVNINKSKNCKKVNFCNIEYNSIKEFMSYTDLCLLTARRVLNNQPIKITTYNRLKSLYPTLTNITSSHLNNVLFSVDAT